MKKKILLALTILIYILLLILFEINETIFGYLCAIDFILMFLIFVKVVISKKEENL